MTEVLSSDEDEIDDAGQDYLTGLEEGASKVQTSYMFSHNSIQLQSGHGNHCSDDDNDNDDNEDSEYEPNEETPLESYITPLDLDDANHDEYILFKEVMQSNLKILFIF